MTNGICGQNLCELSESSSQNTLLVKMLMGFYQQYMSPYAPIWKRKVTKSGRSVYRLTLSVHHERYRVCIIGISKSKSRLQTDPEANPKRTQREARTDIVFQPWGSLPGTYWAVHQPPVCGMDDGIPDWMGGYQQYKERMQCYGNAVVPQQFYPVFLAIAEMERLEAPNEKD